MNRSLEAQILPTGRPIPDGWISSYFGARTDPFTGLREYHKGLDFAGKDGEEIYAVASGLVTWSAARFGYGQMVEINHGNGYITRYAHNRTNLVKVGDVVTKGQRIALMGSTGRSTGPHVHFEVLKNGRVVDPAKYVYAAD
jgi:murein DD-endopeptidase MepM/ murein hydrolase activator NlpD